MSVIGSAVLSSLPYEASVFAAQSWLEVDFEDERETEEQEEKDEREEKFSSDYSISGSTMSGSISYWLLRNQRISSGCLSELLDPPEAC